MIQIIKKEKNLTIVTGVNQTLLIQYSKSLTQNDRYCNKIIRQVSFAASHIVVRYFAFREAQESSVYLLRTYAVVDLYYQ
jgi:mannose/fructose-specific phosphotransferase system component IIA